MPERDQRPDDHRWRVAAPDQPGAVPVHERPERPGLPARTRHDPNLPTEPKPRSRWTNRAPKLCRQPPSRRRPGRPFRVRTSAAVETAITSGATCAGSSTARRPFRAEASRRHGQREDPHRNESRDLPCAHAAVFRHRGAPPPLTRTRSQSQAKQQPAGGGPALLPFVQGGRLAVEHETPAITPRRALAPGGRFRSGNRSARVPSGRVSWRVQLARCRHRCRDRLRARPHGGRLGTRHTAARALVSSELRLAVAHR
jgi:hypothetical protein